MDFTSFLKLSIGLVVSLYLLVLLVKNWHQFPLILLPFIWYLPEQTSPGRLLENYMYLRWFSVVVIPLIIIIEVMRRRNLFKTLTPGKLFFPISIFIIFTLISAIINDTSWVETAGYLAVYLRYPLFFLLLVNIDFEEKLLQKFITIFFLLLFLQIPEVLYRYFALGIKGDDISWSLGSWGTTNLGIYSIYAVCIILASALHNRFTIGHIIGILIPFLFALFGEIKAIVIWVPISVLITIYFYPFQTKIKKYSVLIMAILTGAIFFKFFYTNWQHFHGRQLDSIIRTTYLTLEGEVGEERKYSAYRLGILFRVIDELKKSNTAILFGEGPGSSLAGNFFKKPSRIMEIISETKDTPNQIASALLDVGIIGLALYYIILIAVIMTILRVKDMSNFPETKSFRILKTAYPAIIFYYLIIGPLYHPVWRFDAASYIFYFLSSELYHASRINNLQNTSGKKKI